MAFLSLSADWKIDPEERNTIEALVPTVAREPAWRISARTGRSYALLELADSSVLPAARNAIEASGRGITVYAGAIIALAVFPVMAEALSALENAFLGCGAPAGVLVCHPCDGGLIVEWDPERLNGRLVMDLIDIELGRFGSGRTAELLSPLSPQTVVALAREQLQAPTLTTERVLDVLIDVE